MRGEGLASDASDASDMFPQPRLIDIVLIVLLSNVLCHMMTVFTSKTRDILFTLRKVI